MSITDENINLFAKYLIMDFKILKGRTPTNYKSIERFSFSTLNELAQNISKLTNVQKKKIILESKGKGINIDPDDIDLYIKALNKKIAKAMGADNIIDKNYKEKYKKKYILEKGISPSTKKILIEEIYFGTKRSDDDKHDRLKEDTLDEVLKSLNNLSNLSTFALEDFNERLNSKDLDKYFNALWKEHNIKQQYIDAFNGYLLRLKKEVKQAIKRRNIIETPKVFYDDTVLYKLKVDLEGLDDKKDKEDKEEIIKIIENYTHVGDTIVNSMLRGNYTFQKALKDSGKVPYSISPKIFYKRLEEIQKLIEHLKEVKEGKEEDLLPEYVYRGFNSLSKFMIIVGLSPGECLKNSDKETFDVGIFKGPQGTKLLEKALEKIDTTGPQSLSKEEKKVLTEDIIEIIPYILVKSFDVAKAKIYSDKGFVSTSADWEVAEAFSKDLAEVEDFAKTKNTGVVLKIKVPEKFRKRKHSDIAKHSYYDEKEVLFPPNTKIKLKKQLDYDSTDKILYIAAEMV